MNKKGFTLVEILAVIVILAIITTIATVTFSSVKKKSLQRQYDAQVTNIQLQSEKYASNKFLSSDKPAIIMVNDLVLAGLLESENGNVKDPYGNIINCYDICLVKDKYTNNYVATMQYNHGDNIGDTRCNKGSDDDCDYVGLTPNGLGAYGWDDIKKVCEKK
ncbi:MAG: type II secretion system protein [Bacilli bacterium]|nr:type II secretion system protein [Bacilli bacterium]